jgi:hypothetical protein
MCSNSNGYPERLWTGNRLVNPNFEPDEFLYRRFNSRNVAPNGKILPTAFKFPGCSVNRSLYSKPDDVLLHDHPKYKNWGIAQFTVSQASISGSCPKGDYSFQVFHVPTPDNYSHSEIECFINGNIPDDVPNVIKKKFREQLAQELIVFRAPEPAS